MVVSPALVGGVSSACESFGDVALRSRRQQFFYTLACPEASLCPPVARV